MWRRKLLLVEQILHHLGCHRSEWKLKIPCSHLSHEAVCVGVLLIFEDNIWIVVAHQFIEALGVACDLALCSPTGPEVVFREVWEKLLVVHGCEFPGPGADAIARARSASLNQPCTGPHSKQTRLNPTGPPELLH